MKWKMSRERGVVFVSTVYYCCTLPPRARLLLWRRAQLAQLAASLGALLSPPVALRGHEACRAPFGKQSDTSMLPAQLAPGVAGRRLGQSGDDGAGRLHT